MIEISCHNCEKPIKLPSHANEERFEADMICKNCGLWWRVKVVKANVQKMVSISVKQTEASKSIKLESLLELKKVKDSRKREEEIAHQEKTDAKELE